MSFRPYSDYIAEFSPGDRIRFSANYITVIPFKKTIQWKAHDAEGKTIVLSLKPSGLCPGTSHKIFDGDLKIKSRYGDLEYGVLAQSIQINASKIPEGYAVQFDQYGQFKSAFNPCR